VNRTNYTNTITHGDFEMAWLNDEKTRLSVCFTGEVPTYLDPSGEEVADTGAVDFLSDKKISNIVGKKVIFHGGGDHDKYVEQIYHA
jgi:hypothetical protein